MPETIQIKIRHEDRNRVNSKLKTSLHALEIRTQNGDIPRDDNPRIARGDSGSVEIKYTPPSVLLTITGQRLDSREQIINTFNSLGIEVLVCGQKITW